jgi:hypothetical protein
VIAGVMTTTHRGGAVARLIDPALPEPHRFMPPPTRRRDDRQPTPRLALLIFGNHEDGTRQLKPPTAPSAPGWDQYCVILASVQTVRPRCAAGAAPGPRLRVPHAKMHRKRPKKRSQRPQTRLTGSAASGMTPSYSLTCANATTAQSGGESPPIDTAIGPKATTPDTTSPPASTTRPTRSGPAPRISPCSGQTTPASPQRPQTTSSRLRLLAHHHHPRRILPHPLLPGQRPRSRRSSHRRHPHRPHRQPLAAHNRNGVTSQLNP